MQVTEKQIKAIEEYVLRKHLIYTGTVDYNEVVDALYEGNLPEYIDGVVDDFEYADRDDIAEAMESIKNTIVDIIELGFE